MTILSIGDLAQTFQLRRQNVTLKSQLDVLTSEISSGVVADIGDHLSGDFVPLSSIERSLSMLQSYQTATAESGLMADMMQVSLNNISDASGQLSPSLLLAGDSNDPTLITATGVDAHGKLEQAVAALNTSAAGRSLFAGAATDGTAMAPADTMMTAIRAAIAGETTADGVVAALKVWFDTPGGGFDTMAYTGSTSPAGPVRLADGQTLALDVTAADPAMRDMLRGFATAALLADKTVLGGNTAARANLARQSGEQLLTADAPLATLRAKVGSAQNRIESIKTGNATQASMLEIARSELIGADPYDTATELEAVQSQLKTLYTITARLSRLNLADYL